MQRTKIVHLLERSNPIDHVLIKGWVRTKRDAKDFSFIEINDGSCLSNIQVIADQSTEDYELVRKLTTGSAVALTGALIPSQGKGQQWEPPSEKTSHR
jgi:asparaginyl-tRNA synthetase